MESCAAEDAYKFLLASFDYKSCAVQWLCVGDRRPRCLAKVKISIRKIVVFGLVSDIEGDIKPTVGRVDRFSVIEGAGAAEITFTVGCTNRFAMRQPRRRQLQCNLFLRKYRLLNTSVPCIDIKIYASDALLVISISWYAKFSAVWTRKKINKTLLLLKTVYFNSHLTLFPSSLLPSLACFRFHSTKKQILWNNIASASVEPRSSSVHSQHQSFQPVARQTQQKRAHKQINDRFDIKLHAFIMSWGRDNDMRSLPSRPNVAPFQIQFTQCDM